MLSSLRPHDLPLPYEDETRIYENGGIISVFVETTPAPVAVEFFDERLIVALVGLFLLFVVVVLVLVVVVHSSPARPSSSSSLFNFLVGHNHKIMTNDGPTTTGNCYRCPPTRREDDVATLDMVEGLSASKKYQPCRER